MRGGRSHRKRKGCLQCGFAVEGLPLKRVELLFEKITHFSILTREMI